MDVGALTPPLWGFEEREKLMIFYERACGARLHAAYFRPGGVHQDLPQDLIDDIAAWARAFPQVLDDIETLITENRIFKQRNVDIAVVSQEEAQALGFSGVMVRGSGIAWDLRRSQPYECYDEFDFKIPLGRERRLLRPLSLPDVGDAGVDEDHPAGGREARRDCRGEDVLTRGKIAPPRRGGDEELDGGADPSLQALHRGLPRAGGRGLCRGRGAEGRVRRLSGRATAPTSRTR